MAQLSHFEATETAADITSGLADGRYLAQPRGERGGVGVLYASSPLPPATDLDFFQCRTSDSFIFYAGTDAGPTWCKSAAGGSTPVARAEL